MAFTETFGGTTIYPSDVSYRAISLSANVTLSWPLETATNGNVVAQIMDVTPSAAGFTIEMPPANEASPGETALFFNAGSYNFTVADNDGNTIVSIAPGLAYQVYLRTNTTVAGQWRTTQFGAGTSSATAGSLVGAGIKAINTTLNQSMTVSSLSVNYTAGSSDRASAILWTGGAGTITLPAASTVGNDWFFHIRNGGTGAISMATTGGELINGSATVDFNPGDSSIIVCDGSGYFTIGFGQAPEFLFDYVSIDLTSQTSPYTLTGANLNRIAYQFSGVLTTNMQIIVPATIQQYWVGNFTTGGSYTLTVKTSAGTGVAVARDSRSILYCNGTDVVTADTGGISIPILVSQGGTGATTASGARTNLGATSIGNALFTAVDEATARNAIIAAKSGANSDITSLSGLTTPLSVAQGGTGAATLTANGLVYGSGTAAVGVTAVGTTGQVLVGNTGAAPSWATLTGIGVTSFTAGTTGLTPSSATTGAITLAGTLVVANGGTGATTLTGYVKGSGTTALTASATIPASDISSGAALTKTDDTNVTLTLGGSPTTALLAATSITAGWTGQLSVARGGTGASTLTSNGVLYGSGTSAIGATAAGATGEVLVGNTGGAPSWSALTGIGVTSFSAGTTGLTPSTGTTGAVTLAGTLVAANGGTGQSSYTIGDLLYASGSTALSKLADVATGNALISGGVGVAPSWGKIGLTTHVSGTLEVGNGGTGATSLTTRGVLIGNGTSAVSATAAGTSGQVLVGYTGADPSWANLTSTAVTSLSFGSTGLTPSTATQGAITVAGTLVVANGGTGATTLTSGYLVKGNGTSAVSASVIYDTGTNVGIGTASPGVKLDVFGTIRSTGTSVGRATLEPGGASNSGFTGYYNSAGTRVGYIGFANDASGIFLINSEVATNAMTFSTAATERMRIDSSGNVGIGTSSPASKLDVVGIASARSDISTGNSPLVAVNTNTGSNTTKYTSLLFQGYDTVGAGKNTGLVQCGPSDANYVTSYMAFQTRSGDALTERMRIDSSGNVGIGTSGPGYRLDVASADTTAGIGYAARIRANATAAAGAIQFTDSGVTAEWGLISASSTLLTLQGAGSTAFRNNGSERARIGSTGILFVNTTSTPTFGTPKLIVDGAIAGKGTVSINSSTATTIAEGAGLLLLIRDNSNGGTAVVSYENAQTPVIISTSGGTTFQTGAPSGSAQIQLASKSGNLGISALASGDRNGASLAVTILQTFT